LANHTTPVERIQTNMTGDPVLGVLLRKLGQELRLPGEIWYVNEP
jgi:hypothetical protein